MSSIIELENVDFSYNKGKSSEFQALKNINLKVYRGEFIAIFGPSGCGKSTLLHIIAGVERPQLGNVSVLAQNLNTCSLENLSLYRQIGVGIIFQNFNLIPSIKNIDNVTLPMAFIGISAEKRKKRAMELLKRLGMAEMADRYPHELSGGQQQRIGIARALANDPPIILADEPIGNLDSVNAKIVLDLLEEISQKEHKTVIMVTHQAWTLITAQKIFYMKDGEIVRVEEKVLEAKKRIKKIGSSYYYHKLFPKLSKSEIYSQILANSILRGYSRAEISRLQELVHKRLDQKIDESEFLYFLDKPFKEGGVGLWLQKAVKIKNFVETAIKKRDDLEKIYQKIEENPSDPLFEEITKIQNWLIADYKFQLVSLQNERLREAISGRMRNIILPEHFIKILDLPIEKGGVGLKVGTALRMGEKLETFLERKV